MYSHRHPGGRISAAAVTPAGWNRFLLLRFYFYHQEGKKEKEKKKMTERRRVSV